MFLDFGDITNHIFTKQILFFTFLKCILFVSVCLLIKQRNTSIDHVTLSHKKLIGIHSHWFLCRTAAVLNPTVVKWVWKIEKTCIWRKKSLNISNHLFVQDLVSKTKSFVHSSLHSGIIMSFAISQCVPNCGFLSFFSSLKNRNVYVSQLLVAELKHFSPPAA